ncbi:hypothetical protein [Staphylococcus saprophyticus]|uniref:hypothetical protein n=1 Tax=Staphylococcus saprophyticus TaxID=29385 RepID=UPI0008533EE5|nr:hypothetical protein [Staphylococcus saprophyticus]MDW4192822.1 hypothetical protein [Staphylococcus saprophyticus]MDW4263752.1 hypothetical protein [Staphylococcus saprophyticus]MDW4308741.1 hypothetical protein [Staphylococcus saprophyticus]MDW4378041.1 hypothetical protein [Staphylococcus saprophyticus]MDW4396920.1 hypothetical protein [Staphylococcus saprophyticus]
MKLSDAIKVKYKIDTKGKNTVEMAKLLRDWGVKGFLYSINPRSIVMAVLPEDKAHNRKVMEGMRE